MDQEDDRKMAAMEHAGWYSIPYEDDDSASQGSMLSIDSWELHFDALQEKMRIDYPNGGFVPSDRYRPEFGDWISQQRENYHGKCLSDYKIQKLKDIGFWWENENTDKEIIEFASCNPPDAIAGTQKLRQKKKRPSRRSKEWKRYFEELKSHIEAHDPKGGKVMGPKFSEELRFWIEDQQRLYWEKKKHISLATTISDDHIQKLENIGFRWGKPDDEESCSAEHDSLGWLTQEEELKDFNCNFHSQPCNDTLKRTPSNSHTAKLRIKIPSRHLNRKWNSAVPSPKAKKHKIGKKFTAIWEKNYKRLAKYMMEKLGRGYIILPKSKSDAYFYSWVNRQRSDYKLSRMPHDRVRKLENIGFLWERPEESTAEESCSSEDESSGGWLTQEEERSLSHFNNRNSSSDNESQHTEGHSVAESSDSDCSTIEEQDSKATTSKPEHTTVKARMSTDPDYDEESRNDLRQIARHYRKTKSCSQKKASAQMKREPAWKKKESAYKTSEVHNLKEQCQKAHKLEEENHVLRGKVEQLEKQNDNLNQKLVWAEVQKERYQCLLEAHGLVRKRHAEE